MASEPVGMILAAGLGTRLRPLTLLRAKPAVPLLNRPLVRYAQELLLQAGIQEMVVNLHHLPETVRKAVSREPPATVHFSREDPIQGTAGALRQARRWLAGRTIVLVNGKIYFEENLGNVLRFHREQEATATLVLVPLEAGSPFSPVLLDAENRVRKFATGRETRDVGEAETPGGLRPHAFTGVHVLGPDVLDYIPEGPSDTVRDIYPRLIADARRVVGFVSRAYWCEASTPARYLSKSMELLRRKGLSCLPPAPAGARWTQTVLGSDVRVAPGVELENCIVWDRVEIAAGNRCANAIVAEGVRIPPEQGDFANCVVTEGGSRVAEARSTGVVDRGDYAVWPFESGTRARIDREQR